MDIERDSTIAFLHISRILAYQKLCVVGEAPVFIN
jgi:hypothetical protein